MTICKRCGGEFNWLKHPGGWVPLNADGTRHRCPPSGSRKPLIVHGRRITGARYTPSCGYRSTPPWESCACSGRLNADKTYREKHGI